MPTYLRRILASAWALAWPRIRALPGKPAVQWAGLAAGYVAVFAGYTTVLIALFIPAMAVAIARGMLLAAVLAGVVILGIRFGRLLNRPAPAVEAVER